MSRQLVAFLVITASLLSPVYGADLDALPDVPEGFKAQIVAKEPDLMHPGALAFDKRGRLFVGGGPQFRRPTPDTPPDSIKILIDRDGDGVADEVKTFATGFNCIQALAWKGDDLYVANCPDVTIVRDTDGDDVADEYQLVFTGLGHLRHGLHGFNFGPDGKLYMTQGNSTAQKHAPQAFRDLMHIDSDLPDNQPLNKVFTPQAYKHSYINGWPSSEGGVLRCDADGRNLEIYSRGYRNPWDMAMDDGFNWIATDNDDGPEHDRVIMPFFASHFGKVHPWSYSWTGRDNPPTAPMSGLFAKSGGSGVGVVYDQSRQFPEPYRDCFFIGDWTAGAIYFAKPKWDGALMTIELETMVSKGKALFRPTDVELGPDGALYVAGWGSKYGSKWAPHGGGDKNIDLNEGRVFRIWHDQGPLNKWDSPKRRKPHAQWNTAELIDDLASQVQAWRVNAQDELIRRGKAVAPALIDVIDRESTGTAQDTWAMWTLGRLGPDADVDAMLVRWADGAKRPLNQRAQALRILVHRRSAKSVDTLVRALSATQPRLRFEAALGLHRLAAKEQSPAVIAAAAKETDRLCHYAMWRALQTLQTPTELKLLMSDERPGVRRAALLALLEQDALTVNDVLPPSLDPDNETAAVAQLWLQRTNRSAPAALAIEPPGGEFAERIEIQLRTGIEGASVHYTLDGSQPTERSKRFEGEPVSLRKTATLQAALFRGGRQLGGVQRASFRLLTEEEAKERLVVWGLKAKSNHAYRLVRDGLRENALLFTDRKYAFRKVPVSVRGATYIQTANDDGEASGPDDFLSFHVNHPVTVLVAHDDRSKQRPAWMRAGSDDGYVDTGEVLDTTDTKFRLFRKDYPAGRIALGDNRPGRSNYIVAIQRQGLKMLDRPTTLDDVMKLQKQADPKRGRLIFFREGGVRCYLCHRLDGRGNNVGPDLADLGLRKDFRYTAESIVAPNATIIEGYLQTAVQMKNGDQHFGMVRDESAKQITLFQATGETITLRTRDIARKATLSQSAMPDNFNRFLTAQDVADLAAWLMTQKTPIPNAGEKQVPRKGD